MQEPAPAGTLLPREAALDRLLAQLPRASLPVETVALGEAVGRTLAEAVAAPADVPAFSRATMDGYAVRAADTSGAAPGRPVRLRLAGRLAVGAAASASLGPGEALALATGGMLPEGADAVVPVEEAREAEDGSWIEVPAEVPPGRHVTPAGSDLRRGEVVFPAGHRLRPVDLAALVAAGVRQVPVRRAARLIVVPTGDELVPPDRSPRPGEVREANSASLSALARRDGAEPQVTAILPDDLEVQRRVVEDLLPRADLVLLLGGSSRGGRDFAAEVIGRLPGPGVVVRGVAIRPGRPAILAALHDPGGRPVAVFGVPGHPVSSVVVYEALVRPTLDHLLGRRAGVRPAVPALLAEDLAAARDLELYVRVALRERPGDPAWEARPVPGDSAIFSSLARADGIVRLPPGVPARAGEVRLVELLL